MKRPVIIALGLGAALFCLIYFGLDTKPSEQRAVEKSRAANMEATGIQNILTKARDSLSTDNRAYLEALNDEVRSATDDTTKVSKLKQLSAAWYEEGNTLISGYYAEEIAKLTNEHDAWAVAGTTYILGMRDALNDANRSYARNRAIQSIEAAISLEPENVSDQINLALIYVEAPDTNPMQGILMLRDLNDKYPQSVKVLNQLARLAIQTGQTDKALERLSTAYTLEPDNKNTVCMLAKAYEMSGDRDKMQQFQELCSE